jgi:hypothetical protein
MAQNKGQQVQNGNEGGKLFSCVQLIIGPMSGGSDFPQNQFKHLLQHHNSSQWLKSLTFPVFALRALDIF